MSKDGPRLSRLGVLAPAALSVCIDASVLAAPAAGAILTTVLKELSKAFMLKKWFHGVMSEQEAEHLLMLKGKHGSYLVRESQARPGEFVLSVRVKSRVSHVMILRERKKYHVGSGESFDDLTGLIEHCRAYPLTETSGDILRLLQPVNENRVKAMLGGAKKLELQRLKLDDIQSVPYDDEDSMAEITDVGIDPYLARAGSNGFYGDFVGGGLSAEFRSLKDEQSEHTSSQIIGNLRENRLKNRYNNVIPYDQNRVLIPRDVFTSGDQFSDYINASYIRPAPLLAKTRNNSSSSSVVTSMDSFYSGESMSTTEPLETMPLSQSPIDVVKDKYYIATQGCLWATVQTFWQMIVSNDVRVIAMIAKKVENHKKKCERYWPLVGERERYGDITVETVREYHVQAYVIREFEVYMEGRKRTTVYHYQFKIWPDQHTPSDTTAILRYQDDINHQMLLIANSDNPPEQNILCVHCSAGIGRTGTFITLDMLIDQVKTEGLDTHIDIYSTVKLCRYQRPGMVRNKAQYKFLYQTMRHYLEEARAKADNRII